MKPDPIGEFVESLLLPTPRPYAERAASAQKRVADLLERVGNPHRRLRCLHIAGSKGKGSTALFAESIAEAAAMRTGTFTSPHLETWAERFRLDGRQVSESSIVEAIEMLRPHVTELQDQYPDDPPTFFDSLTALALMLFATAEVELAIIEAGIGARLDATSIAPAIATCITTIEKEHTDKLGHTLAAIAIEKSGVIRRGKPLVLGELAPQAREVLLERAASENAPVSLLGRDFQAVVNPVGHTHTTLSFESHLQRLEVVLAQPAPFVTLNAALAMECVLQTRLVPDKSVFATAGKALENTRLPARVEILRTEPPVIVDAAHTVVSITHLTKVLAAFSSDSFLAVLSLSNSKCIDAVFSPLMPLISRVITTRADPERSIPAEALAQNLAERWPNIDIDAVGDPDRALSLAFEEHERLDIGICATGSVYLAGRARRVLRALLAARIQ